MPSTSTNETRHNLSALSIAPLYSFMYNGPNLLQSNQTITIHGKVNASILVSSSQGTRRRIPLVASDILLAGKGVLHIIDSFLM